MRHLKGWKQKHFPVSCFSVNHSFVTFYRLSSIYHISCALSFNTTVFPCLSSARQLQLLPRRWKVPHIGWHQKSLLEAVTIGKPMNLFCLHQCVLEKAFCTSSVGIVLRIKNNIRSLWTKGSVTALCFHNKIYCIHLYS